MASHQAGVIEAGQSVRWAFGRGAARAPQPASCTCFHSKTGHTVPPEGETGLRTDPLQLSGGVRPGLPTTLMHCCTRSSRFRLRTVRV